MSANEKRRRKRALSEDERTLWKRVTDTLTPLSDKKPLPEPKQQPAAESPPAPPAVHKPAKKKPTPARVARPQVMQPSAPPLAPIDKRTRQRLVRGTVSIDGRLDLHGLTQAQAHTRLYSYLAGAQARGHKTILVITGKGGDRTGGGDERGVLRRMVPHWLQLPEFRTLVTSYEEAHGSHGGSGALYVRIRRKKG